MYFSIKKYSVIFKAIRVLRRIFGPKRDEVTGERRKLHKEELHDLGCGSMDYIELAQDRDRWRALVNAGMNFRVS
jgi:hypothetical protein